MGSHYDETGLLLSGENGLVLERDGGGTWRLDINKNAAAYLGHRVHIKGMRIGFDVLDVYSIEPLNCRIKRTGFISSWQFILGFLSVWAAVGLALAVISWRLH